MATQSTSEGHDGTTTVAVPAVTCASSCPRSSCFCECSMRVVECMCASTRRLPNVRQKRTSTSSARWHRSERQARWRWAERRIWVCRRAQAVSTGDASAGDASARSNPRGVRSVPSHPEMSFGRTHSKISIMFLPLKAHPTPFQEGRFCSLWDSLEARRRMERAPAAVQGAAPELPSSR